MTIKEQLDKDIKTAMLGGDKVLVTTLRGLKSAILYAEVASGSREVGLAEQDVIGLFAKEAKKRQESADMYTQGGSQDKAAAELLEKQVIEQYLPKQLDDNELTAVVDKVVAEMGGVTQQTMGQAIGKIRAVTGATVDGGRIASAVKERISQG